MVLYTVIRIKLKAFKIKPVKSVFFLKNKINLINYRIELKTTQKIFRWTSRNTYLNSWTI